MRSEIEEIERTLNATDRFIESVARDENRIQDRQFMTKLALLRQEHKKTLKIIDFLHSNHRIADANFVEVKRAYSPDSFDCVDALAHWQDISGLDLDPEQEQLAFDSSPVSVSKSLENVAEIEKDCYHCDCPTTAAAQEGLFEQFDIHGSHWTPTVTIPKPFQMTIRDEAKPLKANYSQKFVESLVEKVDTEGKEQEEYYAKYRFRATAPPSSTYLPVYDQLVQKQEQRRRFMKQNARLMLNSLVHPFHFNTTTSRHYKRDLKRSESENDLFARKFHPKPVPKYRWTAESMENLSRQREESRKQRAVRLLADSYAPKNLQNHIEANHLSRQRRHGKTCIDRPSFRPIISHKIPDFKAVHKKIAQKLNDSRKRCKSTTTVQPFHLSTDHLSRTHNCNLQIDKERKLTIKRRSSSVGDNTDNSSNNSVKTNTAAILRTEAVRSNLSRLESKALEIMHFWQRKEANQQQLKNRLNKQAVTDHFDAQKRQKALLDEKISAQQARKLEYRKELEEIEHKMQQRPTVMERQAILIKRQSLDKKYRDTLKAAGVKKIGGLMSRKLQTLTDVCVKKETPLREKRHDQQRAPSLSSGSSSSSSLAKISPDGRVDKLKIETKGTSEKGEEEEEEEEETSSRSVSVSEGESSSGGSSSSSKGSSSSSAEKRSKLSVISEKTEESINSDKFVNNTSNSSRSP